MLYDFILLGVKYYMFIVNDLLKPEIVYFEIRVVKYER